MIEVEYKMHATHVAHPLFLFSEPLKTTQSAVYTSYYRRPGLCVRCVSLQEEYRAEGISWRNIDYIDNTGCINLISKKPTALFHLLDEECK